MIFFSRQYRRTRPVSLQAASAAVFRESPSGDHPRFVEIRQTHVVTVRYRLRSLRARGKFPTRVHVITTNTVRGAGDPVRRSTKFAEEDRSASARDHRRDDDDDDVDLRVLRASRPGALVLRAGTRRRGADRRPSDGQYANYDIIIGIIVSDVRC